MRNLFLYQNILNKEDLPRRVGIYEFKNSDLVGIDVNEVGNIDRRNIVSTLKLRDVFIIQPWFRNLISQASSLRIIITKIEFRQELDDGLFTQYEKLIRERNNYGLVDFLRDINIDGEYDINSVSFFFKGDSYKVTAQGVLETFADDPQFSNVLTHPEVWSVLAGSNIHD